MPKVIIILCSLLFCFPRAALSDSYAKGSEAGELREVTLETLPYKHSVLYLFKPDYYLSFNHTRGESKEDYGLKFAILKKEGSSYQSIYESIGSADSYSLKPSFFTKDLSKKPLLILAEVGAEYSWGIRVFLLTPNLQAKDLGTIDVAVQPDSEFMDGPISAIPFIRIVEKNGNYQFTFAKDVIYDPGGLNQKTMRKEQIHYCYDGVSLQLIKNNQ